MYLIKWRRPYTQSRSYGAPMQFREFGQANIEWRVLTGEDLPADLKPGAHLVIGNYRIDVVANSQEGT